MKASRHANWFALALVGVGVLAAPTACSSSSSKAAGSDAGAPVDATADTSPSIDAAPEVGPSVTGMKIVTASGAPLQAAAGDAVPLKVVLTLSDGTTEALPAGSQVTWIAPTTVVAEDPDDAGPNGILPATGAQPTAFFVQNPFRPERTDYPGTLFVVDPGTGATGALTVTASVGDAGTVSATLTISPTPEGDPDAGANLFQTVLRCAECHGQTGAGSPPTPGPDGSVEYQLQGMTYPYPAPGLNDTSPEGGSPNLAADPAWSAALLGMAAQADMDNNGVALRKPMPDELGKKNADGGAVSAEDFAHIYAFLKKQTQ